MVRTKKTRPQNLSARQENNYKKFTVERLAERIFVTFPRVISFSHRNLSSLRHPYLPLALESVRDMASNQNGIVNGLLEALLESQQESEKWGRVEQMFDTKMDNEDLDSRRTSVMLSFDVTSKIEALWAIAQGGKESSLLSMENYHYLQQFLYSAVFELDDVSLIPATLNATKDDYDFDSRGRDGVTFEAFAVSMLEFADNWTPSRETRDYVSFLQSIINKKVPPREMRDPSEKPPFTLPKKPYFSGGLLAKRSVNGYIEYYKCDLLSCCCHITDSQFLLPRKPYSKGWLGAFQQQKVKSTYVLYTPIPTAVLILAIALCCIPLGVVEIVYSKRAKIIQYRYDSINHYAFEMSEGSSHAHSFMFNGQTYSMGSTTFLKFELKETLAAPVLLMYHLKGFHQNYRNYLISKDAEQLYGRSTKIISDCRPFKYPGEFQGDTVEGYYSPCGSIAWSLFNDSFALYRLASNSFDGSTIPADSVLICDGAQFDEDGNSLLQDTNKCTKKGIALESSVFSIREPSTDTDNSGPIWMAGGNPSSDDPFLKGGFYYKEPGHLIPAAVDEDFIVWSESALLPDFYNIYRVIHADLEAGHYLFDITELYQFPGEKHVALATRNWLGGNHLALGIITLVLGGLAFISSLVIVLLRYPFATQLHNVSTTKCLQAYKHLQLTRLLGFFPYLFNFSYAWVAQTDVMSWNAYIDVLLNSQHMHSATLIGLADGSYWAFGGTEIPQPQEVQQLMEYVTTPAQTLKSGIVVNGVKYFGLQHGFDGESRYLIFKKGCAGGCICTTNQLFICAVYGPECHLTDGTDPFSLHRLREPTQATAELVNPADCHSTPRFVLWVRLLGALVADANNHVQVMNVLHEPSHDRNSLPRFPSLLLYLAILLTHALDALRSKMMNHGFSPPLHPCSRSMSCRCGAGMCFMCSRTCLACNSLVCPRCIALNMTHCIFCCHAFFRTYRQKFIFQCTSVSVPFQDQKEPKRKQQQHMKKIMERSNNPRTTL
eukprot:gene13353-9185_t